MDNTLAAAWDDIERWTKDRDGKLIRSDAKMFYAIQNGAIRLRPEHRGSVMGIAFSIRQVDTQTSTGRVLNFWADSLDSVEFALKAITVMPGWSLPHPRSQSSPGLQ